MSEHQPSRLLYRFGWTMLGNTICILDNFTLSLYPTFSVSHFTFTLSCSRSRIFCIFSSPLSPSRSLFSPISRNQTCIAFHFDHLLEYCFYQFLPGKMQSLFLHFWFCLLEYKVQMKDDFIYTALSWGPYHNIQIPDYSQNCKNFGSFCLFWRQGWRKSGVSS